MRYFKYNFFVLKYELSSLQYSTVQCTVDDRLDPEIAAQRCLVRATVEPLRLRFLQPENLIFSRSFSL